MKILFSFWTILLPLKKSRLKTCSFSQHLYTCFTIKNDSAESFLRFLLSSSKHFLVRISTGVDIRASTTYFSALFLLLLLFSLLLQLEGLFARDSFFAQSISSLRRCQSSHENFLVHIFLQIWEVKCECWINSAFRFFFQVQGT